MEGVAPNRGRLVPHAVRVAVRLKHAINQQTPSLLIWTHICLNIHGIQLLQVNARIEGVKQGLNCLLVNNNAYSKNIEHTLV